MLSCGIKTTASNCIASGAMNVPRLGGGGSGGKPKNEDAP